MIDLVLRIKCKWFHNKLKKEGGEEEFKEFCKGDNVEYSKRIEE